MAILATLSNSKLSLTISLRDSPHSKVSFLCVLACEPLHHGPQVQRSDDSTITLVNEPQHNQLDAYRSHHKAAYNASHREAAGTTAASKAQDNVDELRQKLEDKIDKLEKQLEDQRKAAEQQQREIDANRQTWRLCMHMCIGSLVVVIVSLVWVDMSK